MPAVPCPLSREELISRAQAIARKLGTPSLSQTQWHKGTGLYADVAKSRFGGWNAFIRAAGLTPNEQKKRIPDDVLMRALRDACVKAGGVISATHFGRLSPYCDGPYRERWGTWREVLAAFREWAAREDPGFAFLEDLPRQGQRAPRAITTGVTPPRRYGPPLNFRGLLHAPVNEPGVVMLFAILAQDLGFVIEHVTGSFPDCEAKRRTPEGWLRVRLEFEYQSRNFRLHRHDPAGCDLIVCWEHNWPEAPLEVIELKAEVEKALGT